MTPKTLHPDWVVVFLVGPQEQINAGKGMTAIPSNLAAARLGISEARLRQLVNDGAIGPCATYKGAWLFSESDVEVLKRERQEARR